jgi:enamine deaminase RidA (YjgF/YER057c/UK114 family)
MAVRTGNAEGLAAPPGYSHYAVATGARLVFLAGGVPLDPEGNVVAPGDPGAQAHRVIDNLLIALRAAGAEPADVVKTTVYVVGTAEDLQQEVWPVVRESAIGSVPSTLVGVDRLGYTGQVVEIEAVAVAD